MQSHTKCIYWQGMEMPPCGESSHRALCAPRRTASAAMECVHATYSCRPSQSFSPARGTARSCRVVSPSHPLPRSRRRGSASMPLARRRLLGAPSPPGGPPADEERGPPQRTRGVADGPSPCPACVLAARRRGKLGAQDDSATRPPPRYPPRRSPRSIHEPPTHRSVAGCLAAALVATAPFDATDAPAAPRPRRTRRFRPTGYTHLARPLFMCSTTTPSRSKRNRTPCETWLEDSRASLSASSVARSPSLHMIAFRADTTSGAPSSPRQMRNGECGGSIWH